MKSRRDRRKFETPSEEVLRGPAMQFLMSVFYRWIGEACGRTASQEWCEASVDWVLVRVYSAADSVIVGPDGKRIDIMECEPADDFGEDMARRMGAFMTKAESPPCERYHGNIRFLVWLWLAVEVERQQRSLSR